MFFQPLHKGFYLRSKMRSAWVKHRHQARLWTMGAEHLDQFSICQEGLNGDSWRLDNTEAGNTTLNVGI